MTTSSKEDLVPLFDELCQESSRHEHHASDLWKSKSCDLSLASRWTKLENISLNLSRSAWKTKIPMFRKWLHSVWWNSVLSINRWCKDEVHIHLLRFKKKKEGHTLMNTGYGQSSYRALGNLGTDHRPLHSTCLCLNHPRDILTILPLPYKRSHSRQELPLRPSIPRSWVEWIPTIRWKIRDFCIFCGIS